MSQPHPSSETKWAETEELGGRDELCKSIGQVHRTGVNGGGEQIYWGMRGPHKYWRVIKGPIKALLEYV